MDNVMAEVISRKTRALKHCNKVLATIDKKGSAVINLNCTGVSFTVNRGDAMYLQLQATRAQLIQDIGSYEIVQRTSARQRSQRFAPAPVGASESLTKEEMDELEQPKKSVKQKVTVRDILKG